MRRDLRMESMYRMRNNIIHLRCRLSLRRRVSMRVRASRSLMVKWSCQRSICKKNVSH
jgi:hypothetical protein